MSNRTIRQALEHAEQQQEYALREAPDLISDFILLANELRRLRRYDCEHPARDHQVAFVSPEGAKAVFESLSMMFDGTPVEADPNVKDGLHLPQPDGTCVIYNY